MGIIEVLLAAGQLAGVLLAVACVHGAMTTERPIGEQQAALLLGIIFLLFALWCQGAG